MPSVKSFAIWVAPLSALAIWFIASHSGMPRDAAITLGITWVTAVWWMTGAIPIPAASLVPIALLPFFGVLPAKTIVAQSYGHPLILLLLGGFLLSKSLEKCGVHRRIALGMVRTCGGNGGKGLILGFMLAAALLSMWISNTATTLMLLPIAIAILSSSDDSQKLAVPLMLGIAYASSIGGLGSPIGTPPNLVFIEQYEKFTGIRMTFSQWMGFGVPIVLIMIPIAWLWLTRNLGQGRTIELPKSGPWRPAERRTLIVFALTALAWITRAEPFGGWSAWLHLPGANDASVAFIGVLFLFVLPDGTEQDGQKGRLLEANVFNEIPWGILLLFGGGICLAAGITESGLSSSAAELLSDVGTLPVLAIILIILPAHDFRHRADQQHRKHHPDAAHPWVYRRCQQPRSARSHDACRTQRKLRLQAPRRHRSQRRRLWLGLPHCLTNGTRGSRPQPHRRRGHWPLLLHLLATKKTCPVSRAGFEINPDTSA